MSFDVPPLLLTLDPVTLEIGYEPRSFLASVRLYDFGVAALSLRLPVEELSWDNYTTLVQVVDETLGPPSETPVWEQLLAQVREPLSGALKRPNSTQIQEDFLLGIVHR